MTTLMSARSRALMMGVLALAAQGEQLPDLSSPYHRDIKPTAGPKPRDQRSELEQAMCQQLAEQRRQKKAAKRLKQGKFL